MRTLIVYYSYSGNNRLLAKYFFERIGGDMYEIEERIQRSNFTIVLDMLFKRSPPVKKPPFDFNQYDHIIFMAPIWASRIGSPLKSLLKMEKGMIPEYSFVTFCGYDKDRQIDRINQELTLLIGKAPKAVFELKASELFPFSERTDIKTISRYQAKYEDLERFKDQLDEIFDFYTSIFGRDLNGTEFTSIRSA